MVGRWIMFGFGKRKKKGNLAIEQEKKIWAAHEQVKASAMAAYRIGGLR